MQAIILAAGLGSRLQPFSLHKPKPLLEIKGRSILENTIRILRLNGVGQITVVTGYKHELFAPLKEKLGFDQVIFDGYNGKNSSASLLSVIDRIQKGTLILNGDLYFTKDFFPHLKMGVSQFVAQPIAAGEISWGYITDENCKLLDIDTKATSGYGDGLAFFDNEADLEILKSGLRECLDDEYWECCVLRSLPKLDFYVFPSERFYDEVDSFSDALRSNLLTPEEIARQCSLDGKARRLAGLTNVNYQINFLGQQKVIRIPGRGTERFIDRRHEQEIMAILPPGLTPRASFYGGDIKMTDYLEGFKHLEFCDLEESSLLPKIVERLGQLHSLKLRDYPQFKRIYLLDEIDKYEKLASPLKLTTAGEHKFLLDVARRLDSVEAVLCHRDLQLPNILYDGSAVWLIDFEYAGFSCPAWELGNLSAELELDSSNIDRLMGLYNDTTKASLDLEDILGGQLLSNYIWALWGWIYGRLDLGRAYLARFHSNLESLYYRR